jgi:D-alanine-D-alanine ligase
MRIAVVYNAVANASPDESDVLIQAAAVKRALRQLGHRVFSLACSLNLAAAQNRLAKIRPDIVFNLVESLGGQDRLVHLFPALLDSMGIPYTGSKSEALYFTSNKILAKQWMVQADLPTPPWLGPYPSDGPLLNKSLDAAQAAAHGALSDMRWLVKSLWQHASSGLHEDKLVLGENADRTRARLPECATQLGGACFAEAFIDGREFNISLLAQSHGPQVLPPAEIIFDGYPVDKLRIVGYRAKWEKDSYEYHHTPRRFDFPPQDGALLRRLAQIAQSCWQLFGLGGYGRVDFRVDAAGRPWVLEINTNPCLSPDAGFAAAVQRAGLTFAQAVDRIVCDAGTRNPNPC